MATGYFHESTFKSSNNTLRTKSRMARAYSEVYAKGRGVNVTSKNVFESEENIIPGKDEIVMTTEYQVKYEESQDSLSEKGLGRTESWKTAR